MSIPVEPNYPAVGQTPGGIPGWIDAGLRLLDTVPTAAWVAVLAAGLLAVPVLRIQARRAGVRAAGDTGPTDRRDRALLAAALTPAALFWLAVAAGSARGLIAFGRDSLRWTGGWEYLVPFTLDGVGISFGVLAFRAVRKRRNPDRSIRVAWGAMGASATINFSHEAGLLSGSALGGAYLGLLSVLAMLIFHELLDQFEQGAAWIKRDNPKFGLRWLTWPTNTACAWVAWRNYPVPAGTEATVAGAVAHLGEVRAAKRRARLAGEGGAGPWWVSLVPWVRLRQLDALIAEQRATATAERDRIAAELDAAHAARKQAEQAAAAAAERAGRQYRLLADEHTEQVRGLRSQYLVQLDALRTQLAEVAGQAGRGNVRALRSATPAKRATPKQPDPLSTDAGALAAMFAEHPERDFTWTAREVNRITGAGFSSRAPRLMEAATEHQRTCDADRHERCFGAGRADADDDAEERAS